MIKFKLPERVPVPIARIKLSDTEILAYLAVLYRKKLPEGSHPYQWAMPLDDFCRSIKHPTIPVDHMLELFRTKKDEDLFDKILELDFTLQ